MGGFPVVKKATGKENSGVRDGAAKEVLQNRESV